MHPLTSWLWTRQAFRRKLFDNIEWKALRMPMLTADFCFITFIIFHLTIRPVSMCFNTTRGMRLSTVSHRSDPLHVVWADAVIRILTRIWETNLLAELKHSERWLLPFICINYLRVASLKTYGLLCLQCDARWFRETPCNMRFSGTMAAIIWPTCWLLPADTFLRGTS